MPIFSVSWANLLRNEIPMNEDGLLFRSGARTFSGLNTSILSTKAGMISASSSLTSVHFLTCTGKERC